TVSCIITVMDLAPTPVDPEPTPSAMRRALRRAADGLTLDATEASVLLAARGEDLDTLGALAAARRDARLVDEGRPGVVTYSRKVFVPLTRLCRDRCHYCTFVTVPGKLRAAGEGMFLEPDEVVELCRRGAEAGCKEALFTSGTARRSAGPRPATGSNPEASTRRSTTCGRCRSASWRRRGCCHTSTRASCPGPSCPGSSRSPRRWG